ncbi:BadM/Rrf2 family transcriptional regulator [Roseinatronobacter bogoriensis subsp. barguzinensis]|nr:Rrf2 family nitric oxide-sensitive transcriptional repressor [Rhodobaca bogoriensis DSM 18756]TDW36296.1 BadM/Rrf2 family transcriptional regulator [Rhodobaca barguzinensis]TDY67575.1 BadM/Rrf2 family transcriptional regulator [Rhodobaca bogoriensis DSM 18756]
MPIQSKQSEIMRLTSFTDFGFRALMRMAGAPGRSFSTSELADEFEISRHHLSKIIQQLAAAGIIETRRGGGGGAQLALDPSDVTLGQIVRVLEAGQALVQCFDPSDRRCTLLPGCRLRAELSAAEAAFLLRLDQSTLADIAWRPKPE